jgi:hypothetical protein
MAWVVQIVGYDPTTRSERAMYFAMGSGIAPTDAPHMPGMLLSWQAPSQKVEVGKSGGVELSGDAGQLVLLNAPADAWSAGPYDDLMNWAWTGRQANLYWVVSTWASRTLIDFGQVEQPVADIENSKISFPIRDPRAALKAPLQASFFGGTNTGGNGTDGDADVKGRPKPIIYGVVSNIPGVRVNAAKLIWQIADVAVTPLCVRDGGVPFTVSTVRGSLASLESNVPLTGCYDYYAGAEGTFIRLGSTPFRTLTFDAQEGASGAARTHAQVWSRLRMERCGGADASLYMDFSSSFYYSNTVSMGYGTGALNGASIAATDAQDSTVVGFYWDDATTQEDAVNEVLSSLSGYEVMGFDKTWSISKLLTPVDATLSMDFAGSFYYMAAAADVATPVLTLRQLSPTVVMASTDRVLRSLSVARPSYMPDGAPPYRVNVHWGHNYTVMAETDFNGAALQRLRDKFLLDWRVETASDAAVWDPVTRTGIWPTAGELDIYTGYQPGADGLTCPVAATEASRVLAMLSSISGQYPVTFIPQMGDRLIAGDCVRLFHPQMNLSSGPLFRVLQPNWMVENDLVVASLVLGLAL